MTDDELTAIEARAQAARPGPWVASHYLDDDRVGIINGAPELFRGGEIIVGVGSRLTEADAVFIAAARQDIPALIAAQRALAARLADAERERDEWKARADALLGEANSRWYFQEKEAKTQDAMRDLRRDLAAAQEERRALREALIEALDILGEYTPDDAHVPADDWTRRMEALLAARPAPTETVAAPDAGGDV